MARTLEDVLARRTRALFLNARAAVRMAPSVASLLARELGRDRAWADAEVQRFNVLATQYVLQKTAAEVAAEK
jgi:glycerol-3-phosphate dehydrogenase